MVKKYRVIGRQSTEIWDFNVVHMGIFYCVPGKESELEETLYQLLPANLYGVRYIQ
jgi:hypothetical protein